jgi:hypothetical protein
VDEAMRGVEVEEVVGLAVALSDVKQKQNEAITPRQKRDDG